MILPHDMLLPESVELMVGLDNAMKQMRQGSKASGICGLCCVADFSLFFDYKAGRHLWGAIKQLSGKELAVEVTKFVICVS